MKQILFVWLLLLTVNAHAQLIDTLVNARPYRLHVRMLKGKKAPILFESGGGQDASQWDSIAAVVHQRLGATVITYDRAGFGQSSFDTAGYTILQEIKSLEKALYQFGYRNTPLLLVGQSLGAFYNWVYAVRHPTQVKGIILVDPRIPSYADMRLARTYFQRLDRKDYEAGYMSLYYLLARMERTSDYVRQLTLPASIPLLDIMAERGPFSEASENERFKADQRNLVKGHGNRHLVYAAGTSHNIPQDKPALLIEEIVHFYKQHL
ncbi:alpha/beta hydrolase [Spirosoma sp. RP8]|uniref:Alpha/beta hydrolase n=1 Tax=Spirosoma liriopis TaxID=2937440 RepID=A0ABT0HUV8_9BACT|nr:alpha/beta hydrolase [Spirosoma liriopis]MCK8495981.1 alpha/beta hydrolase [Spirosoma liriopis]